MTHGLAWLMLRCIMTTSSETVSQFFQFVGLTIFWFKNRRSFLNISKQLKEVSRLRFKLLGLLWPGWLRICRDVCPDDNHGSFLGILNRIASSVKCNQPGAAAPYTPALQIHVCVFQFHLHHHHLPLLRSPRLSLSPTAVAVPWGWQGPRTGAVWGDVALMTWSLVHTWAWVLNFTVSVIISSNINTPTTSARLTPIMIMTPLALILLSLCLSTRSCLNSLIDQN